jgi:putative transposase
MPRSRYRVLQRQYPYFMTATINNWLPVFTKPETVSVVYDCWRFLQQTSDFEIFGYVIMENHLHLVARSHNIEKDMKRFKSYTAREIVACLQHIGADHMLQMLALFKDRIKSSLIIRCGKREVILRLLKVNPYLNRNLITYIRIQ